MVLAAWQPGSDLVIVAATLAGVAFALLWLWITHRAHLKGRAARAAEWPLSHTIEHRRAWVRERVVHWWVHANRVHEASLDDVPEVEFSPRLKHALGWADSSRNLIKISDHHLMDKSKRVADETVAHEVAHIFADRFHGRPCRHNKHWKRAMVLMGQNPSVCFRGEAEPPGDA